MAGWPRITDERLLGRLALDDAAFGEFVAALAAGAPARPYDQAARERALGYPWARPAGSFVLRDGEVTPLDELDPAARAAVVAAFTRERDPVVAVGSNGAPESLRAKLGHLTDPDVLVLTGRLHDLDVGATPVVTLYGSMPATLFASPGTAVGVSVVWLTAEQLTALTWAEVGYRLARIEGTRFVVDGDEAQLDGVFAYVARLGAFCPDGEPVALAAVPATGRRARALTQEQLLDLVAPLLVGPQARAEDVIRLACTDLATLGSRAREHLWAAGRPLPPDRMTLLPSPAAASITPAEAATATMETLTTVLRAYRPAPPGRPS